MTAVEPSPTTKPPGVANRRINGLQMPWDELQVTTWILFPLIVTHYYAFLYFLLWDFVVVKVICTIFFSLCTILAGYSAYMTCSIDPADNILCAPYTSTVKTPQNEEEEPVYCYICETHVDTTSKHCRTCDKCVVNFDHHCKWLNTCVGESFIINSMHSFLVFILGRNIYLVFVLLFLFIFSRCKELQIFFIDNILSIWFGL